MRLNKREYKIKQKKYSFNNIAWECRIFSMKNVIDLL
jgi:hypothetical protein